MPLAASHSLMEPCAGASDDALMQWAAEGKAALPAEGTRVLPAAV